MSSKPPPKVELTIPIIHDMELAATKTAEVVAKHMGLDEEKSAEISMALIEATINAFEHSNSQVGNVEIHFVIQEETLLITVPASPLWRVLLSITIDLYLGLHDI